MAAQSRKAPVRMANREVRAHGSSVAGHTRPGILTPRGASGVPGYTGSAVMSKRDDPRPLTSEPLPLDLLNTVWVVDGVHRDLLESEDGLRFWLALHGFETPADGRARAALVTTRETLRAFLEDPADAATREQLNAVLGRGAERTRLAAGGSVERGLDVAPTWRAPWTAASQLVHLHAEHGDRIRRCANPDCVLWFLDVSRPGTRRWCSMAACGNREKARRHYAPARAVTH